MDIVQIVRPYLRKLMEMTNETVHFVRREGIDAVYIDKVESYRNGIQMVSRIGSRIPLYCSGVGKAMVSEMDEDMVKDIWNRSTITAYTPYTITDYEAFTDELEQIRERGYALDNEENEAGVRCIAVSLNTFTEQEQYAFSISAPVSRMNNERYMNWLNTSSRSKNRLKKACTKNKQRVLPGRTLAPSAVASATKFRFQTGHETSMYSGRTSCPARHHFYACPSCRPPSASFPMISRLYRKKASVRLKSAGRGFFSSMTISSVIRPG